MTEDKIFYSCQMCGSQYQMGPHRYDGKHIAAYKLNVCKTCYEGNWDGWAPHYEDKLIAHLREEGIPIPKRIQRTMD